METIKDFEDILFLFHLHKVNYLIIGGLAFIFHAKPRYTKDIDLWIDPQTDNIHRTNKALAVFGSPILLHVNEPEQIVQIGVAPNRIDLLVDVGKLKFDIAWEKRIVSFYGQSESYWIDIDSLIIIKESINAPKHQEDVRVLRQVKLLRDK
ncbi:hypothetical protein K8T06_05210 [bacterium]|nr:hypothetical protein [bacterium]